MTSWHFPLHCMLLLSMSLEIGLSRKGGQGRWVGTTAGCKHVWLCVGSAVGTPWLALGVPILSFFGIYELRNQLSYIVGLHFQHQDPFSTTPCWHLWEPWLSVHYLMGWLECLGWLKLPLGVVSSPTARGNLNLSIQHYHGCNPGQDHDEYTYLGHGYH